MAHVRQELALGATGGLGCVPRYLQCLGRGGELGGTLGDPMLQGVVQVLQLGLRRLQVAEHQVHRLRQLADLALAGSLHPLGEISRGNSARCGRHPGHRAGHQHPDSVDRRYAQQEDDQADAGDVATSGGHFRLEVLPRHPHVERAQSVAVHSNLGRNPVGPSVR
jgi:hypothetical protein